MERDKIKLALGIISGRIDIKDLSDNDIYDLNLVVIHTRPNENIIKSEAENLILNKLF